MLSVFETKEVLKVNSRRTVFVVPPMGVPQCKVMESGGKSQNGIFAMFLTFSLRGKFSLCLINVKNFKRKLKYPIKSLNCLLFHRNSFVLDVEKHILFLEATFNVREYYVSMLGVLKNLLKEDTGKRYKMVQAVRDSCTYSDTRSVNGETNGNGNMHLSFTRGEQIIVLREFPKKKIFFGQRGGEIGYAPLAAVVYKGHTTSVSFFVLANYLVEEDRRRERERLQWSLYMEGGIVEKQMEILRKNMEIYKSESGGGSPGSVSGTMKWNDRGEAIRSRREKLKKRNSLIVQREGKKISFWKSKSDYVTTIKDSKPDEEDIEGKGLRRGRASTRVPREEIEVL